MHGMSIRPSTSCAPMLLLTTASTTAVPVLCLACMAAVSQSCCQHGHYRSLEPTAGQQPHLHLAAGQGGSARRGCGAQLVCSACRCKGGTRAIVRLALGGKCGHVSGGGGGALVRHGPRRRAWSEGPAAKPRNFSSSSWHNEEAMLPVQC